MLRPEQKLGQPLATGINNALNLDSTPRTPASIAVKYEITKGFFDVKSVTDEQAKFVARLLPSLVTEAREQAKQTGKDLKRSPYNKLILQLIPKLPQEEAESLFAYYDINNPIINTSTDYNALEDILLSDLGDFLKRKALEKMHVRIELEQAEQVGPDQEVLAVESYRRLLNMMQVWRPEERLSPDLYEEEIKYILGVTDGTIVEGYYTDRALAPLKGAETRHAFAKRQILGERVNFYKFAVDCDEHVDLARRLLAEFPDDVELRDYLEQQVKEYKIRQKEKKYTPPPILFP